jgi:hypothetical protein
LTPGNGAEMSITGMELVPSQAAREFSQSLMESKRVGEMQAACKELKFEKEAVDRCMQEAVNHFDQRLLNIDHSVQQLDANVQTMHHTFVGAGNKLALCIQQGFDVMRDNFTSQIATVVAQMKENLKQDLKKEILEQLSAQSTGSTESTESAGSAGSAGSDGLSETEYIATI